MKMNLGTKIGGGFAGVLLIALLLGGMAIISMRSVSNQSHMLAYEYVPEVEVASSLQKNYGVYLQDMIYYATTGQDSYYQSAKDKLVNVRADLEKAKELAASSEHLVKLRATIGQLEENINHYENLSNETATINGDIDNNRQIMDESAAQYMQACSLFLESQNKSQAREIASGAGQQKLKQRALKKNLVNDIIDLGNAARVEAWKAQANRDPEGLKSALTLFPQIDSKLDELLPITYLQADKDEIAATRQSAHAYRDAIQGYLEDWNKLTEIGKERTPLAFQIQDETIATAEAGMAQALTISQDAEKSLSRASTTLIVGLIIALIIGCALAFFITRMITGPVISIADVATSIAKGDLSKNVELESADEIGHLADSFRQMSAELQDKARAADEIANGNLDVEVNVASQQDVLGNAMVKMIDSLQNMNKEVQGLTNAALEGELDTRADATKHNGDYGKLVGGINELLNAIVSPIQEGARVLTAAAQKDMTQRVKGDYKGQLAELKNNINTTVNALDESLSQVGQAVEQVSSASNQISSGSQALASGASQQASSLEEISSSLEEMSSMTKQNADNSNQANSLSSSARESAVKGSKSMQQMTEAINRIKTSSDETAKIVKTIDEIAFQTNLLALNAAVEAARAGEAGKGFAVVAEEVRNLAQRAGEAAKNTAEMIDEAVQNAEDGVSITDEVASVLNEIVEGASKVSDLVAEISAAAGEQAQGIEQVNTAVSQMDQLTQQNASNSEESASAAEELNSQAEELNRMVSEFKLSRLLSSVIKPETGGETANGSGNSGAQSGKNRLESIKVGGGGNGSKEGNGVKSSDVPDQIIPLDDVDLADF